MIEARAVFPEPGFFRPPSGAAVHHPPAAAAAAARVAGLVGLPTRVVDGGSGWWVVAGATPAPVLTPPDRPDGFALAVTPDRIELTGRGAAALGYAAASLADGGLACRRLVDFADLAVRGVHLDLKGPALAPSYLDGLLARLGALRVNTLLVEYEDRFPYPAELDLAAPDTVDVPALLATAARHGMTVVPLVQCLGHLEYALRRPRWRNLAEDDRHQQLCPMLPGSLEFFAGTLDAVLAAHPEADLVHIGGDEPWSLGACQRCAGQRRPDLYAQHVAAAARVVIEAGRRPVVWDDVLYAERDPALVDALPAETVLMPWEYAATGRTGWARWGNPQTVVATSDLVASAPPGAPLVPVASLPPEERRLIETVKSGDHPLPWARALAARGRTVIGAAAARGADGPNAAHPHWSRRLANVGMWAAQARSLGIEGVVSTAWAAYDTVSPPCEPLPTAEPVLAASAARYWNVDAAVALPEWCRVVENGTVHELRAVCDSAADPLVRACARHRLLTIATDEVAQTAAWHRGNGADDPAASAARAMAEGSADRLISEWRAWQEEYAEALRDVYAGEGGAVVAAAKAAEPVRRLGGGQ
ncbi:hexosaminidase [Micromonospora rhizosphaerae]|uniref:Hexosaminidase n=1 Tax=Micromonospora rhizosphaerae TaxID=568872 RepID=A0A1C6SBD1_9ACTN|nr:family 20 glycosylhydrolase [Micromonospora rhizosphaerae]SCL26592.1 hexosaminidase [Micromonospora rhizosphaerae]